MNSYPLEILCEKVSIFIYEYFYFPLLSPISADNLSVTYLSLCFIISNTIKNDQSHKTCIVTNKDATRSYVTGFGGPCRIFFFSSTRTTFKSVSEKIRASIMFLILLRSLKNRQNNTALLVN